ncbi:CACTA en-spm transposon protein [Cucumis melo var. makuwa]|uniref:CACTA en-spm transposon protein n=1 Tax=Cucumis melo var. makuwa TaxID=1194695 RepID=A0A5D3D6F3_CUCMM|nr:CACTA en-spm transposon protein [Cucumis melo var. makuwa]
MHRGGSTLILNLMTLDPRNMRLGLASDGFNPFGQMSTSYSMWKIDVYLQLLIEELKGLWTFGGGVMIIGESGVLVEVLHVQYPLGIIVWLFKFRCHQVDDHIEDDTLCRSDVDLTIVERSILRHVTNGFIDDVDEFTYHMQATMNYNDKPLIMSSSYPRNNFMETDAMFLEFEDDLDNIAGGSSSVGDNAGSSSQQPATLTPKRCAQSQLLELECHVAINARIPMTIASRAEKPISPHVVRFNQAIGVCVRKTFFVCCLKWADIGREYIEVVKGDLQRFFVLVEDQMLMTFKEFRVDYHRHFKKYSNLEETRANPPNALVGLYEDWHFLCNHYMSRAFQEQSRTNKAAKQKQPYNHRSGSKPQRMCIANAGTPIPAYPRG